MTFAPATLLLVVASFIVGALLGWVLQRASARQSLARLRQAMAGEVSRLQDRLDQCTSDLTAETRALGQARNHGEDLRTALSASETRCRQLEGEVARLPALEETIQRLTNGLRGGADELRRLRASNHERAQALDDLQASASQAAEALQATQIRLNETLRSLAEAAAENARLEEQLAVARRVADVAREQVNALATAERRVEMLEGRLQTLQGAGDKIEIDLISPVTPPAGSSTAESPAQAASEQAFDPARQPPGAGSQAESEATESTAESEPTQARPETTASTQEARETRDAPAMEQLVEALGAGIREMARKFDESIRNQGRGDDPFDRLDEKMRREAQRFARRQGAAGRFDDAAPRPGLFERLLGEVLDEVRRERRR